MYNGGMTKTQIDSLSDGWLLRVAGQSIVLTDEELAELARAVSFRLQVVSLTKMPSGIGLYLGDDAYLHLCHTDEAEDVAADLAAYAR